MSEGIAAPALAAAATEIDIAQAATAQEVHANRIVSVDYCADQYVLQLAGRARIAGLSPDATRDFSYLRAQAAGLPQVRPSAEEVLALRPDLVVRSYGGGVSLKRFLEQLDVPVLQIGYAGSLADIQQTILTVAAGLQAEDKGRALVRQMEQRLAKIADMRNAQNLAAKSPTNTPRSALYMTPSGVTSGPGTLVDEMLRAAALENFQQRPGWHALPLERLAYESPQLVAVAFFGALTNHLNAWSAFHHPIARAQHQSPHMLALEGAWTSCGGWFLVDAIEALHDAATQL
ncbi:MAG: ABC transporter substrate-binding protein [Pseudomonadota bacterium]